MTYVPPEEYRCGTVVLKIQVTLYLEAGAIILGCGNLADYTSEPGQQAEAELNVWHLIFASDAENAGLEGPGRVDGQGPQFWGPSGRVVTPSVETWRDVAIFDWKPLELPSPLLEFVGCRHLRVEDVRIENPPRMDPTLRELR
jgi:polygalacturonase